MLKAEAKLKKSFKRWQAALSISLVLTLSFTGGCFMDFESEPYYGRVLVPRAQEFRWSNGGLPRVFDPAFAVAPPDSDAVRALYEGLTEQDPRTLQPLPAVAARWESSPDARVWTFHLRADARWSNGDPVTAHDFVRSWQRVLMLGDRAPHARLLENIAGTRAGEIEESAPAAPESSEGEASAAEGVENGARSGSAERAGSTEVTGTGASASSAERVAQSPETNQAGAEERTQPPPATEPPSGELEFGVEAVSDYVLRVRLLRSDLNFPALVAHTVFRPVHESNSALAVNPATVENTQPLANSAPESAAAPAPPIITNGAFRLSELAAESVTLERAAHYWDARGVALERVRFVATENSEAALAAYRAGQVDAITNAAMEPLALKLISPHQDFRRITFGALTYYQFNTGRAPFADRRVREALALAIDRKRLTSDATGGATDPAQTFMPDAARQATVVSESAPAASSGDEKPGAETPAPQAVAERERAEPENEASSAAAEPEIELRAPEPVAFDPERARALLAEAGFAGGENFPRLRLLVNRNEQHRAVAQAVAAMWRNVLGVETEIVMKPWDEYEAALREGDYDLARRGFVMQTTDETSNMLAMFAVPPAAQARDTVTLQASPPEGATPSVNETVERERAPSAALTPEPILTEAQALRDLPAIPLYFASSYALVKPYVQGFETNMLDAPLLRRVRIDTTWRQAP